MTGRRWTFERAWTAARDIASWGLGAWWGNGLMTDPGPADLTKTALVAALLGLPFVFRADELRRQRDETPSSSNGRHPDGQPPATERAPL